MAVLSKAGITNGATIQVGHVTQSVDAFTGVTQYDITLSGSFVLTGSMSVTGSVTSSFFTGSLIGNATTSTYVVSNNQNYKPKASPTFQGPGNLGLLAGSITLGSGVSAAINPVALTGKVFQTDYWVTTTKASGSTSPVASTLFVEEISPGAGSFLIKEVGASSNDDVNFIIVYR
jgi:hypothetical protein